MLDIIYVFFFWILVLEVVIFLFLNLPSPKGWKGTVVKFLTGSRTVKNLIKGHLIICTLAAIFFYDCMRTEDKFRSQKNEYKHEGSLAACKKIFNN